MRWNKTQHTLIEGVGNKPGMSVIGVHAIEAVVFLVRGSRGASEHSSNGARSTWQRA